MLTPTIRNHARTLAGVALAERKAAGDLAGAVEVAKSMRGSLPGVEPIVRAAVDFGTLSDPNWAGNLEAYQAPAQAFLDSLRPLSFYDTITPFTRRLPLNTRYVVATGATFTTVSEGAKKPLRKFAFALDALPLVKVAGIAVTSADLLRFSYTEGADLILREGGGALADGTNDAFLAYLIDSSATPSTGSLLADLRLLLNQVATTGHRGRVFAAIGPENANAIATMETTEGEPLFPGFDPITGGRIAGVNLFPTLAAGGNLVAIDASQLVTADLVPVIVSSDSASIEMIDNATGSAASTLTSMFQTNSICWRFDRYVSWAKAYDTASAVITGVNYGGT